MDASIRHTRGVGRPRPNALGPAAGSSTHPARFGACQVAVQGSPAGARRHHRRDKAKLPVEGADQLVDRPVLSGKGIRAGRCFSNFGID